MNATKLRPRRRAWWVPLPGRPIEARPARRRRWPAALVLLAGYVLFSHGCHVDEDTELLIMLRQAGAAAGERWFTTTPSVTGETP